MEVLYVVLIIVAIFIAILAAAVIGNIIVRRNRKLKKRKQSKPRPRPPVIPGIITSTIPNIVPITAPNATRLTANSVVAQVAVPVTAPVAAPVAPPVAPPVAALDEPRVQNIDDLNKYYVAGNDPFIPLFNDELKDYVKRTLTGYDNPEYATLDFDYHIDSIIEETVRDYDEYIGTDSENDLNSNPYERLLRVWEHNQPHHFAKIEYEWIDSYTYYLELYTRRDGLYIYNAIVTIIYTPSVINDNNGNILSYQVDYINMDNHTVTDTHFYNIDDRDRMILDMNIRMPSLV